MANTASNVSVGKPNTGGAIYYAKVSKSLVLPTATTGELTGFTPLGYISDAGLTNSNSPSTSSIKAWGGDTVLTYATEKQDTFAFRLIESKNADVLKFVYGENNVTGSLTEGLTIKANIDQGDLYAIVVDMIMSGGTAKRVVVPSCSITSIGDISYADADAIGYDIAVTAVPDASGNTHYEYIKNK